MIMLLMYSASACCGWIARLQIVYTQMIIVITAIRTTPMGFLVALLLGDVLVMLALWAMDPPARAGNRRPWHAADLPARPAPVPLALPLHRARARLSGDRAC